MAQVFTYTIVPLSSGTIHTCEGVSHEDALSKFIEQPIISCGYHEGNYACGDGEKFVVVGPTQEDKQNNVKTLVTIKSSAYCVTNVEHLERDERVRQTIREKIRACGYMHKRVEVIVNSERQIPMGDFNIGFIEDVTERGIRINNKMILWSDIDDVLARPAI